MKGIAIATVGALVLAVVALVLLWLFVWGGTQFLIQTMPQALSQITSAICNHIFGPLTALIQGAGFCK